MSKDVRKCSEILRTVRIRLRVGCGRAVILKKEKLFTKYFKWYIMQS